MKLIIGLGNPGEKYKNNRHNVGYMVVDKLSLALRAKLKTQNSKLKSMVFVKTNVFMNESGAAVKKLLGKTKKDNLYVVHDDLDIPLGQFKIQLGKGPKVHNGLNSVEEALGTGDFWRVRVGVDNRDPENRIPGDEYVLQDFTGEERQILDGVIQNVVKALPHG